MKKIRVYELAKELGMESKMLTAKLIDLGYSIKAYNSSIEGKEADEIRAKLSGTGDLTKKTPAKSDVEVTVTEVSATTTVEESVDESGGAVTRTEVEDKRIQAKGRTTIIRRRRTTTVTEEPPVEVKKVEPEEKVEEVAKAEETTSVEPEVEAVEVSPEEKTETIAEAEPQEVIETKIEKAIAPEDKDKVVDGKVEVATGKDEESVALDQKELDLEKEVQEEDAAVAEKAVNDRPGLARIIKRSAIVLPVEEKRPPQVKKHVKAKSRKPVSADRPESFSAPSSAPTVKEKEVGDARADRDAAAGKGKKAKRFVKFHHEPGVKARKGGKGKGYTTVDMEDVAMAGGRFSSALKVGRGGPRGGKKGKHSMSGNAAETKAIKKRIKIQETISIGDFAHRMGVKVNELIAKLMGLGVMATVNQSLDVETATIVASDFGYEIEQAMTEEISIVNLEDLESGGNMQPRPPVVTVMGHVDHGKTSILDAIRDTDVAKGEAGGITQHIGAHYVRSSQGDVVFLDTPGHAAFTEMRARGAKVTDIVVLVVAADDGVMDQTKEAINHAKAAEVPIVVAVNKIDKEGADPMRVKRELSEFDLTPEDWGGQTIYCETSAKKGIGIEHLLEQILLQAEILELAADKKRKARGRVIEARIHKGRGPVATILVQQGTLRAGDSFVVGEHYGKVRSLLNDKGKIIKEATPSWPVEVQGLSGVPKAGDEFIVVSDEKMAKNVSAQRMMKSRETLLGKTSKISLDNLFDKLQEGNVKELKILLRADVQGTLEAFGKAMEKLSTDEIRVKIIHEGTGAIIDSDVLLAAASEAIIIGFNVRPSTKVQEFAVKENVDVRYYDVIYNALDDIRKAMTGLLDPIFVERVTGSLEVRETFTVPKIGTIAGCYVTDGKIERKSEVRLIREGIVVYTGKISSLRRFKDDAKEVAAGYECGVGLENYNDIKVADVMEVFVMDQVAAKL